MSRWAARLFGSPLLVASGTDVAIDSPPLLSLVAYLATCRHRRASRSAVIGALWPDKDEGKSRHCLASTLWRLKGQIGKLAPPVRAEGETLMLDPRLWADTLAFETRLTQVHGNYAADIARLRAATRACDGLFLDGQFTEWALFERERLRCLQIDALVQLAKLLSERGDWAGVIGPAREACQLEPLRESAQRLLMMAYAQTGNRGLAIRQYQRCADVFERELGIEPMPATRALVDEIASQEARSVRFDTISADRLPKPFRSALLESRAGMVAALNAVDSALKMI